MEAARTRSPATTNYDVHSPTWGDGRDTLLPSAMEAASLGNRPSCSPIDPVQVSMFDDCNPVAFYIPSPSCTSPASSIWD
jgi:hypothetical protein